LGKYCLEVFFCAGKSLRVGVVRGRSSEAELPCGYVLHEIIFLAVSSLAEIEQAIQKLPPDQWLEIRRWMDRHAPKVGGGLRVSQTGVSSDWLAKSTGVATSGRTTDAILQLTRGEE
jgi:hypothetical protein